MTHRALDAKLVACLAVVLDAVPATSTIVDSIYDVAPAHERLRSSERVPAPARRR